MTDPRYDPRFQRGYAGPEAPSATADEVPEPRQARPVAWQPEPPRRVDATPAPADPITGELPSSEEPDDDLDLVPRRDPYRIALLVVSIVLLAAAGGFFWQTVRPSSTSDAQSFLLINLADLGMPALMLAGLVGVLLWIVLGILRRP